MTTTGEILNHLSHWFALAQEHPHIPEPTAMALATASAQGLPSVRIVLLKAMDENGAVFYTNNQSRKGGELQRNPHAALCWHWPQLERQVRMEGKVEPVTAQEADAYFASRARENQLGAWASAQSRPLESMEELDARLAEVSKQFEGKTVTRPPYWSGWRLIPSAIELWEQQPHRLHHRRLFTRIGDTHDWNSTLLYP